MKNTKKTFAALILAAGVGARMCSSVTKQKMNISGMSVLKRCVIPFLNSECISKIVVVCRECELDFAKSELSELSGKPIIYTVGGKTRRESAELGFARVCDECDFVAIHDGARCLVTEKIIDDVCTAALSFGCATASTKITDTVKLCEGGYIASTLDREKLYAVQTPQVFECELYRRAISEARDIDVTDDNMLLEAIGFGVKLVDTGKENIKITTAEDIDYAEYIINKRGKSNG